MAGKIDRTTLMKLKKAELIELSRQQNLSCKGNKTQLAGRLLQLQEDNDVNPEDSVSQAGHSSRHSSAGTSSSAVRAAAKAAGLAAAAKKLKEEHVLELEEIRLRQRREALRLEAEVAAAEAEAEVYSTVSSKSRRQPSRSAQLDQDEKQKTLNPLAAEWSPESSRHSEIYLLRKCVETMHLPKPEPTKYNGDPLKYWHFLMNFENNVPETLDDKMKLSLLFSYCKDKALEVIEPCASMLPTEGYKKARQLLQDRCGNTYVIVDAWVKKVTEGAIVQSKNSEEFRQFADDLTTCVESLRAMGCLAEISSQRVLAKIVERLPQFLRVRWLREVQNKRKRTGLVPDVDDLLVFVCDAAEEICDPVYGRLVNSDKSKFERNIVKGVEKSRGTRTFTTSVKADACVKRCCKLCEGDHTLFGCEQFKRKAVQERRKFVAEKGLCFNCLKAGHRASNCRSERTCTVEGCGERHTKFLHPLKPDTFTDKDRKETSVTATEELVCKATGAGNAAINLPVVRILVRRAGDQKWMTAHALLDNASSGTFCSDELRNQLNLKGNKKTVLVTTLGSEGRPTVVNCVSLEIKTPDKAGKVVYLSNVYSVGKLSMNHYCPKIYEDVKKMTHLANLDLVEGTATVQLLIGQDNPDLLVPMEVRRAGEGQPYAVRTALGWTLNGPLTVARKETEKVSVNFTDCLEHQVEKFWKLEGEEDLHDNAQGMSVHDREVVKLYEDTIRLNERGHYEVAIPVRNTLSLPVNRRMVEERLQCLKKKLSKDKSLHQAYTIVIEGLFKNGHAELVEKEDLTEGAVWYLPHHAVLNPKKPGKVRVVFDCAARYQGISLNDQVHSGPDLTNPLIKVLMQFRQRKVAFTADIEGMFNQVYVPKHQRDMLRFLWWPHGDLNSTPAVYRMTTHLFGGKWSPSACNYALKVTAESQQTTYAPKVVATVLEDFYVDDCLKSVDSMEEGATLVQQLQSILEQGGFKLTKFASNKDILEGVPMDRRLVSRQSLDLIKDETSERALGLLWNIEADTLSVDVTVDKPMETRRQLLSYVSSVYDPLGILTPFTIPMKMELQNLTRLKVGWDESLPNERVVSFQQWSSTLSQLKHWTIPRCIQDVAMEGPSERQLHIFAGASERAYGAVAYIRQSDTTGNVHTSLIMSKGRLAPLKAVSIPRLELSAATLAVRVGQLLKTMTLEWDRPPIFWTDSTIVLQYIHNKDKRFKTFVANRLAIIHSDTQPSQWRHIPSEENPADDISRGSCTPDQTWFEGPSFLKQKEINWPNAPVDLKLQEDCSELKEMNNPIKKTVLVAKVNIIESIMERYSSWHKLKTSVAWLSRFMAWLRSKTKGEPISSGPITHLEFADAERAILKFVQKHHLIKKGLKGLNPVTSEDGLIRVGGRLSNADLPNDMKYPIILPAHHVSSLIVHTHHQQLGHAGTEQVMAHTRRRYWIIKGRSNVKRILRQCVVCKRQNANTAVQKMADLPEDRVNEGIAPFEYVGVDCFGPFLVRQGRSHPKRYGCLFTCMKTRAIHIEVLASLDTDSFINGFRRFVSRRGQPIRVRSDNGRNFVGAERELREAINGWNQQKINNHMQQQGIEWIFNTPNASHHGGVWERMIRSVRKTLAFLTRQQVLSEEVLTTVMCEAEMIVNSRPIAQYQMIHGTQRL